MNKSTGLSYYLPEDAHPHTILRIPDSHTLYIGPSSCTRRHILHEEEYGNRAHTSSLFITEADIISGDYEQQIGQAIQTLLDVLIPSPRIFLLVVFCIDDFLGTDEENLIRHLEQQFPQQVFAVDHIDPIAVKSPSENTVMSKRHLSLYRFLRPEPVHDDGVTFMGNFIPLPPECELFTYFKAWGLSPIRELFRCQHYEDYQAMARSQLCLSFRFPGEGAWKLFTEVLHMPVCFFPPEYDASKVSDSYTQLAALLHLPCPQSLTDDMASAKQDAAATAKLFAEKGLCLAVDSSAFLRPFAAAAALIGYGFSVTHVFHGRRIWEDELPIKENLIAKHAVQVLRNDDFQTLSRSASTGSCLAIGGDCHKILRTDHYANVWHDEGFFGFHGIHQLMALLRREAGC